MKAYINGMEIPFKDLGEPQVTFEGETYEVITDQTGEPYFMYNEKAQYIELRDDEGNDITPGHDNEEEEDEPSLTKKPTHTMLHLDTIELALAGLDLAAIAMLVIQTTRQRKQIRKEL